NLQTDYVDAPATIRYRFLEGQSIYMEFSKNRLPILYFDTPRKMPKSAVDFRNEFNLKLSIIPTLGPLEAEEETLDKKYVNRWSGSKRAPRMFRNIWFHDKAYFKEFKETVENTWQGM